MPSLLPGYEYDIFISYRQNDNRSGWVTEFVKALEEELAATIKDPVSVYFDSNPHDGLLESHNVDKSLEGKMKCLIFIPILSQTYCDPKSFAWTSEFCAFNKLVKEDALGRYIKLESGNVSSRILSVKIHDLDKQDTSTLDKETGGALRAIDFIYREPGVNRPLRPSDSKSDNLSRIDYRNQMNKVANAVKEILQGIKMPAASSAAVLPEPLEEKTRNVPAGLRKASIALGAILVVAVIFFLYSWKHEKLDASKSSIAIIPFRNNTGDETKSFYGVGIASEVSTKLGLTKKFDFISSLQATMGYQQSTDSPVKIGKDLGVTHILAGTYQTADGNIQVTAELVDASSGNVIWNLRHRTRYDDVFEFQSSIASTVLEKFSLRDVDRNEAMTSNTEAFYHCMRGEEILQGTSNIRVRLTAIPEFRKAIELDSGYLRPWVNIIRAYGYYYFYSTGSDSTVTVEMIEQYMNHVEDHFEDSWEKKLAQSMFAYWILADYGRALKLSQEIREENPEAWTPEPVILWQSLKLKEAINEISSQIRRGPTVASYWIVAGHLLRLSGDSGNAEKAFERAYVLNNDLSNDFYETKLRAGRLEDLPAQIKTRFEKKFACDLLLQKKDYTGLIGFLREVKTDSIFTAARKYYFLARGYSLLERDDSARIYATEYLELIPNGALESIEMNSILRREKEVDRILDDMFERRASPDDLFGKWTRMAWKMFSYAESGEYEKANLLLKKMNNDYPQVGGYEWLNTSAFERIKKAYPAFVVTIEKLRLPPHITLNPELK